MALMASSCNGRKESWPKTDFNVDSFVLAGFIIWVIAKIAFTA